MVEQTIMVIEDGTEGKSKIIHLRFTPADEVGDKIKEITGVKHCFIEKYTVTLFKGPAFAWDEIIPEALDTITGIENFLEK